jgi:hypothetical protein
LALETYKLIDSLGATLLDLNDGANYATTSAGLHDLPDSEPVLSAGYAAGAVYQDSRSLPRPFSLTIQILAGIDIWPRLNAAHNAARDTLVSAIRKGKLLKLRTSYEGAAGYYDIEAYVQNLQRQEGTAMYVATLSAPRPQLESSVLSQLTNQTIPRVSGAQVTTVTNTNPAVLTSNIAHNLQTGDSVHINGTGIAAIDDKYHIVTRINSTQFSLPVLGQTASGLSAPITHPFRDVAIEVGGNTETYPSIVLTPTQQKSGRWRYRTRYTVVNPSNERLISYPVQVPFPLGTKISQGKAKGDGGDVLVLANGLMTDRWWYHSGGILSVDRIWVLLDLAPGETEFVDVLYGFNLVPDVQAWVNRTDGPMFDMQNSTNALWRYDGAFMDPPGSPSTHSWQWSLHVAQSQGFSAIRSHKPAPWRQASQPGKTTRVNAAGAETPAPVQIQGYAGIVLHHPLRIASVQHSGRYWHDATYARPVIRSFNPLTGALIDHDLALPTVGGLTSYGPITTDVPDDTEGVIFALRTTVVRQGNPDYIYGADLVDLTLATSLTVTGGAEEAIYMLEATVQNLTTGHSLTLFGVVTEVSPGVWHEVVLDLENQLVTMGLDNFYYALYVVPPVRADWLHLAPGQNWVRIRDEGVYGLSTDFSWRNRRL